MARAKFPFSLSTVSSEFGMRVIDLGNGPINNFHYGMDFAVARGSAIRLPADGRLTGSAASHPQFGNWLQFDHGNFVTRYHGVTAATLSSVPSAAPQDRVIGYTDQPAVSTGPHLHFELIVGGSHRDPRQLTTFTATYQYSGTGGGGAGPIRVVVDGIWGSQTIRATQTILSRSYTVVVDGVWGPQSVRALQRALGVFVDGDFGPQTIRAWQRRLNVVVDGDWGSQSVTALQRQINTNQRIFA